MKRPAYRILYTREAKKSVEKLDPTVRKLIRKAIESLAVSPEKGKPLSYELAGLRSLRTSDYRVIYRIKGGELLIIVVAVGHRREIYKKLSELLGVASRR
ncbi:MAG: type II toxin-antitoxin system RelE/ParE family toxin [Acidobacteria bacterium]|nr:type II toxin-antitoxin system RelE/ParE family toxin [Acidobacteriota bacterium]MBE3131336.1 type II toxin-antitoxin system RelE/ParE family toxin [Acidobacteriota bacterium]